MPDLTNLSGGFSFDLCELTPWSHEDELHKSANQSLGIPTLDDVLTSTKMFHYLLIWSNLVTRGVSIHDATD